ncbi:MAG: hypothetical protein WCK91_01710 [bacterium]
MKREDQKPNFGIPIVDNTPMGQIAMQGNMYRSLATRSFHSLSARIAAIVVSVVIFILPSLLILYFLILNLYLEKRLEVVVSSVFPFLLLILYFSIGVRIILNNIKNR